MNMEIDKSALTYPDFDDDCVKNSQYPVWCWYPTPLDRILIQSVSLSDGSNQKTATLQRVWQVKLFTPRTVLAWAGHSPGDDPELSEYRDVPVYEVPLDDNDLSDGRIND